jgi:hypothetical protein
MMVVDEAVPPMRHLTAIGQKDTTIQLCGIGAFMLHWASSQWVPVKPTWNVSPALEGT